MIAQQTITKLQLLGAGEECVKFFKPFMCLLLFGLCNSSGEVIKPSCEECVAIKSEVCADEAQLAMDNSNTTDLFPSCNNNVCGKFMFYGDITKLLLFLPHFSVQQQSKLHLWFR